MHDVVVIGAGFGGLGAALELARRGARVVVCEALKYPGGCASTFARGGHRYESGATLFSGFAAGQRFARWLEEEGCQVPLDWLDPVVTLRGPGFELPVWRDRSRLVEALATWPGAPNGVRGFFALQREVADALWPLFDAPERLEPLAWAGLRWHVPRVLGYASVARWVGRPLEAVLSHFGVARFEPLRRFVDAQCQITVQCGAAEAEAPFALSALDYCWRGTAHVRGGIGRLATAMVEAIERRGGEVRFTNRVLGVEPLAGGGWRVLARRGALEARHVVANVLPGVAAGWLHGDAGLEGRQAELARGWGAVMRYLVVRGDGLGREPKHLQLIDDAAEALSHGNHVFVSVSGPEDEGRAPAGQRTVTMSTHVPLGLGATEVEAVQARLWKTVGRRAPEIAAAVLHSMPASPRTFERFTLRPGGAVGGLPRRAGLHNYRGIFGGPVRPGLWLVGDSEFPGQSTLATALGGARVAARIAG